MSEYNFEKFKEAVDKYKNILFCIPGSPDPDALASCFALQKILNFYTIDSDIVSNQKLSLAQNIEFTKLLNIPLKDMTKISLEKYEAYAVTDYQSNIIDGVTGKIPCAIHIDHHEKLKDCERCEFTVIDTTAGSASTLVTLLLKELNIELERETMENVATALIFGIQTDTDRYTHASKKDIEAMRYLTPFSKKEIIKCLNVKPLEPETILYYKTATANETFYKDWGIYPIGYISSKHRDSLAIVADMKLKESELVTVITFGIVEDKKNNDMTLNASFRTNNPNLDLDSLIKGISPEGGARKFKGAFQVNLNYFHGFSEREKLLELIESATIEKLRKAKDGNYILDIKNAYTGFIKRLSMIFKR